MSASVAAAWVTVIGIAYAVVTAPIGVPVAPVDLLIPVYAAMVAWTLFRWLSSWRHE